MLEALCFDRDIGLGEGLLLGRLRPEIALLLQQVFLVRLQSKAATALLMHEFIFERSCRQDSITEEDALLDALLLHEKYFSNVLGCSGHNGTRSQSKQHTQC